MFAPVWFLLPYDHNFNSFASLLVLSSGLPTSSPPSTALPQRGKRNVQLAFGILFLPEEVASKNEFLLSSIILPSNPVRPLPLEIWTLSSSPINSSSRKAYSLPSFFRISATWIEIASVDLTGPLRLSAPKRRK